MVGRVNDKLDLISNPLSFPARHDQRNIRYPLQRNCSLMGTRRLLVFTGAVHLENRYGSGLCLKNLSSKLQNCFKKHLRNSALLQYSEKFANRGAEWKAIANTIHASMLKNPPSYTRNVAVETPFTLLDELKARKNYKPEGPYSAAMIRLPSASFTSYIVSSISSSSEKLLLPSFSLLDKIQKGRDHGVLYYAMEGIKLLRERGICLKMLP